MACWLSMRIPELSGLALHLDSSTPGPFACIIFRGRSFSHDNSDRNAYLTKRYRTPHSLISSWEPGGGGLNRISNNPMQQSCSYLPSPQLGNWGLERMTDMSMLIQQMQEKAFSRSPPPRPSLNLFSETEEWEWNPGGGVLLWEAQVRLCEPKSVILGSIDCPARL